MASAIETFRDDRPILKETQIVDRSKGYEALSKVAGESAHVLSKAAESMAEDHSNAMLMHSVSNTEQIKTGVKVNSLAHPDKAEEYAENGKKMLEQVKQISFVNDSDRAKLNQYIDRDINEIDVHAATVAAEQSRRLAASNHYTDFMNQIKQYQDLSISDPEKAEEFEKLLHKNWISLATMGAITPRSILAQQKMLMGVQNGIHNLHKLFNQEDATAEHYQTANANLIHSDTTGNVGTPIDQNTAWHVDYNMQDKSFRGSYTDIIRGMIPNPEVFLNLSANDQEKLLLAKEGVNEGMGLWNSAQPWQHFEATKKELSAKGEELNYKEMSKLAYLNHVENQLKNGDYVQVMSSTPAGGKILHDYSHEMAVNSSDIYSPEQQARKKLVTDQKLIDNLISLGEGMHLPSEYIQPYSKELVQPIIGGFQLGSDPNTAINQINKFDAKNLGYLVNSIPDKRQALTVYETGHFRDNPVDQGFTNALWISQQDGIDYKLLNTDKNGYSDNKIKEAITPKLSTKLAFLAKQDNTGALVSAETDKALRFVKYKALQNSDSNLSKIDSYIDEYVNNTNRAYKIHTSYNGTIDQNVIPTVTSHQADAIISYAISETYKDMRSRMNEAEFNEVISRFHPMAVSTVTGRIQVVDSNGNLVRGKHGQPAFDQVITHNLIGHALNDKDARRLQQSYNPLSDSKSNQVFSDLIEKNYKPHKENKPKDEKTFRDLVEQSGKI